MFKLIWNKIKPLFFELLESLLSDLITELFSNSDFLNADNDQKKRIIKLKIRQHAKR